MHKKNTSKDCNNRDNNNNNNNNNNTNTNTNNNNNLQIQEYEILKYIPYVHSSCVRKRIVVK